MRTTITLLIACGALAFAPDSVIESLSWDRLALMHGEVWRLWTGHVIHFSSTHAATDIFALAIVGAIAERELGSRAIRILLLAGAPLISLALVVTAPGLAEYRGASAIAALLGTAAGLQLWRRAPAARVLLGCITLLAIAKTALDFTGHLTHASSLPAGIHVAWQAHLAAVIVAVTFAQRMQSSPWTSLPDGFPMHLQPPTTLTSDDGPSRRGDTHAHYHLS
ncbi:MAG: rhombosortase [Betaproteobacteria bacterium]|nr:rhombosortase [Betaproteobacteria bacterium]